MDLTHEADGIPAERSDIAPVTLVGAAHHWAARAKRAELELAPLRRRLWLWRLVSLFTLPAGALAWVLWWMLG